jgi:hypothetical protein
MFLAVEVQCNSSVLAQPSASTAPAGNAVSSTNDLGSPTPADGRDDLSDLRAQMKKVIAHDQELEAKVARLEAAQAATQPSAADTTAAIAQVLHDADLHSQFALMTPDSEAGWDPNTGIYLKSDDGNFLIHPFVLLQVRNVSNFREEEKTGGSSDSQNGFEIRRMQLGADGNVYSPDLTYRIFVQTDRAGGDASLFDAWVRYHIPDTSWSIQAGQFKAPLAHEQMVFDRTLMAADRSLSDDILANGEAFSEGAMAIYQTDVLRGKMDVTNGYNVNDVNFEDFPANPANFGVGGRAEYKAMGQWKDYDQFTSLGDKEDLLVFGGGADWTEAEAKDAIRQAADVQWNHGGLGLFGGYIGRYTARNGTAGNTWDYSFTGQISYIVPGTTFEPFGRYDYLKVASREFTGPTNTNVHEITIGVNYYLYGQNCKLTLDGTYLPNGSPIDDNGSGVLVNNGRGEFVARAQVQLGI